MRSLLQEVVDMQMVQLDQKGLQLHWVPPTEPMPVQADPAKLKQVVLNVVSNAIKFTDVGSISIKMEIPSETNKVVLTVRDTGCGVPPEQQQKLFRPFVMADGTRTRKHGGTGLGLAISRKLMELMAGTITLYSPGAGKGTTVEIAMPAIAAARLSGSGNEIPSKIGDADSVSVASESNVRNTK
jgi:signal transduction histidine kinase